MTHKLLVTIAVFTLLQSCIKQDKVEVEGTTLLEEKGIALKVGETFLIEPSYSEAGTIFTKEGENGEPVKYEYSLDKPSILSLSSSGEIKALKEGNATVEVSAFGAPTKMLVFNVVQSDQSIAKIELKSEQPVLVAGSGTSMTYIVKTYEELVKSGVAIESWTSSNAKVATVDADGNVKSGEAGIAKIQAQIGEVLSFPYSIIVVDTNVRRGNFYTIDYKTEGYGRLELNNDNTLSIVFESDFLAENATGLPGVVVYLNNGDNANVAISTGLRVGGIPQNTGEFTMNVSIPEGQNAGQVFTKYSHILLICEPFKISFGAAKLN